MLGHKELLELIKKTQSSGIISTDTDCVVKYQDMIGHCTEDQLTELARGEYAETFYKVYDLAYGTTQTLRFYFSHCSKIEALMNRVADLEADLDEAKRTADKHFESAELFRTKWDDACNKNLDMHKENERLTSEVLALKAKLYDLMTA